jgi:hypothetical protein
MFALELQALTDYFRCHSGLAHLALDLCELRAAVSGVVQPATMTFGRIANEFDKTLNNLDSFCDKISSSIEHLFMLI